MIVPLLGIYCLIYCKYWLLKSLYKCHSSAKVMKSCRG